MTLGPDLDTSTLHRRLEQGIAGAGSSRGSLTRCAAKYKIFLEKLFSEQRDDSTLAEAIEACKGDLIRELHLYMIEMRRVSARISVTEAESKGLERQLALVQVGISEESKALQEMQKQYPGVKQSRRQKEEYEALAKMANHRESRRVLEQKLIAINSETLATEQTQKHLLDELTERETQFQLLIQIMLDLKAGMARKSSVQKDDGEEEEEGAIPMDADV